jgi:endogenous inhibitor of DNA gyrase (YacG/DUF329 family)
MSTPTLVTLPHFAARWSNGAYKAQAGPSVLERCKLISMGAWAAEEHAIAGNPLVDDLFSGVNEVAHENAQKRQFRQLSCHGRAMVRLNT